jgi:hypothetical protein
MVRARGDNQTGDLLAWEPPKVTAGFEPGVIRGSRLSSRLSQAVALALKQSDMTRAEIATAMSAELGYQISENMLANYASEGAEAHRITLERFIALVEVTGCTDLLGFVAEMFGKVVVDRRYQALINVHLAEEAEARIQKFKAAEKAKWGAI